eukprot:scaffold65110_cov59-Phaeocystis_antarctica.AAC.1
MSSAPSPSTSPSDTAVVVEVLSLTKVGLLENVPAPLLMNSSSCPLLPTTRSSAPSPFTSPSARAFADPAGLKIRFARIRSSVPSPFTSPSASAFVTLLPPTASHVGSSSVLIKLPRPSFNKRVFAPLFAITRSASPSPSTSPNPAACAKALLAGKPTLAANDTEDSIPLYGGRTPYGGLAVRAARLPGTAC